MRSRSAVLLRSLMFVPGHRPRMLDRALGLGEFPASNLDVAILDLEDGVPLAEKESARATIAAALKRATAGPGRYVRLNASAALRAADLDAIARKGLDGVGAPKITDAREGMALVHDLEDHEIASRLSRWILRRVSATY